MNYKKVALSILKSFFLTGFLLSAGFSYANEPLRLSLEEARQYALEHNLELRNARADANIAARQVWEITATGLPQIDGSVGYQYFTELPTNLIPAEFFGGEPGDFLEVQFGTEQNLTATLSVNQLIFDGSYIVGLQAARIFRELAQRSYIRSEIEIKSMVTETYYLALASRQNLGIMQDNLVNLEKTLFETQKMFEEGFTDAINVDQLKLTVANLKNRISSMERQKDLSLNMLKFQIGLDINQPLELTDELETLFRNISLEVFTIQDFNPENHIDFRVMQSQEQMQLMTLRREWSFYLPNISGFYTRQENAFRNEFNFFQSGQPWFPTSILGININIPIFSSGYRASRVQQTRLELEKAQNNTRQVAQSLMLQKQDAQSGMQTALEQYDSEKDNLQLAERILNRTQIMFREGMASSLELTQASDQFISTQANYINAMFELLNAKNKLEKALGRL
ncbi:MAG: TolC family protein [Bacteroidetes bacterium]|nr:MAG: TolC family protein [Bacteroidota bacterium]